MRLRALLMLLALFPCAALAVTDDAPADDSNAVQAQQSQEDEQPQSDEEAPNEEEARQEAWRRARQPGPHHARLAQLAGKWKTEITQWRPTGEPVVSYGVAVYAVILRGRFVEEQFRAEMMGMPFEGRGLLAYDNTRQKYVTTWASNADTHVVVMEGAYDEAEKTLTSTATIELPTGETAQLRSVEREIDADTRVSESYVTMPGAAERKHMEVKYTRVKS